MAEVERTEAASAGEQACAINERETRGHVLANEQQEVNEYTQALGIMEKVLQATLELVEWPAETEARMLSQI
mgnify:CR=1 FL=1